jgi:putative molybdopterin biosynthesis protein
MVDVDIYYTPAEVAGMFKLHKHTVWRKLKTGEWKGFRVGNRWRISETEVNKIRQVYKNEEK